MHLLPASLALPALISTSAGIAVAFVPSPPAAGTLSRRAATPHPPLATSSRLRARQSKSQSDGDGEGTSKAINPAKQAALDGVMQRIERNYGRGSIQKLGDADRMVVECVGSGSLTLGEPNLSF